MKRKLFDARDLLAVLHLIAYSVIGFLALSALGGLAGAGFGLLVVFLIGLIPLALATLLLAGIARWEEQRVRGLYGFAVPAHPFRKSQRTDGWRLLHTLWLQVTDWRNWIGALHMLIISLLGAVAAWLFTVGATSFVRCVTGNTERVTVTLFDLPVATGVGILANILICIAAFVALWGLARAHRAISRSMLVPSETTQLRAAAVAATQRRDDAMTAAQIERSRIERDLHDGVQPRLVAVGMTLGMAKAKLATDPEAAAALIDEAHTSTKAAITDLRQLARGFHPAVLEDRGLDAALSALAAQSRVPVQLDARITRRYSRDTEAALYFTIAESITNAVKHAGAGVCRVTVLERPNNMLWARVEDDGHGGAQRVPGGGLDGIANRVTAAGGTLTLSSPIGGPTTIEVSIPC